MGTIGDYNTIMNDRKLFNQIVYTPMSEALNLLEERRKDDQLIKKIEQLLKGDVPEILKLKKCAVQFRQVTTPNNDCKHFIKIAMENKLQPVFFEYHDDKFTSNNDFKYSLGSLHLQGPVNKKDVFPVEKVTIVDFAKYDGKKLKDVKTLWGESLVDFHKKLFAFHNSSTDNFHFYEASQWLKKNGEHAREYYVNFLLLCTCFGILFENFLTSNDSDGEFTKDVILPAIDKVLNLTGLRPLIIPIGPLDMESDQHWISYHPTIKKIIPKI